MSDCCFSAHTLAAFCPLSSKKWAVTLLKWAEKSGGDTAISRKLAKLHLGRAWQEQAGPGYRYFLIFQDKDISMTGAYPMSEFLKILAEL